MKTPRLPEIDLARGATAVEVYPPSDQVVDGADMFHIWVLPEPLPFSLYELEPA